MDMVEVTRKHWPVFVATLILWLTVFVFFYMIEEGNQGHFTYVLDDSYVHMSIAKNLVNHRVWGITRYGFSSSVSSILWPLLVSFSYFLFGVNEVSPLALNVVFGTLVVVLTYLLCKRYGLSRFFIFGVLLSVIFFTPMPALIFTGMEHLMHILVAISFTYLSAVLLSREEVVWRDYLVLFVIAPLLTMSRYEGLFLVSIVAILFFIRKRRLYSFLVSCGAVLPLVAYGVFSVSKGWFFIPNPILIKGGGIPQISIDGAYSLLHKIIENVNPEIITLLLFSLALLVLEVKDKKTVWREPPIFLFIFISVTLLHLMFAKMGWFFRYEAYLIAIGVIALSISLKTRRSIVILLLVVVLPFLILRGVGSLDMIVDSAGNTYDKQYQTGLFIREFYEGESIAVNDIGAVNYLADFRCVDLYGLGDVDVARMIMDGGYNRDEIQNLVEKKNVKIAIVYDCLFVGCGDMPGQWTKVERWKISNSIWFIRDGERMYSADAISFYSVEADEKDNLIKNLREFSSNLPGDIIRMEE